MQRPKKYLCKCICALLIFLANFLEAWNIPAQQISPLGDFSFEPAVSLSLNSSNNGIATWSHLDTNYIVQAAFFNGTTWGAPVNVSTAGQDALQSRVGMDSTGLAHAVWRRSDGANLVIQTSAYNGSSWSSPINLSLTGQDATDPQIAVNDTNRAIAVWTRSNGSNNVIQASFFDGTSWGSALTISDVGQDASVPQISINQFNKGMAVWSRSDGSNIRTQAAFFDGSTWSSAVDISPAGADTSEPAVSLNDSNIATAIWNFDSGSSIFVAQAARFNGTSWAAATTIPLSTGTSSPLVGTWPSGDAVAVWKNYDGFDRIYYSIYSGGVWSNGVSIVDIAPSYVRLGINDSNLAAIVVINSDVNTLTNFIQASQYNGSTWTSPVQLSPVGADSLTPEVAVNPVGNAIAVMAVDTGGGVLGIFASENISNESLSTIVASPTIVTADGVDFSTITVTLKTNLGVPIPSHTVSLGQGPGSSIITPASAVTNSSGVAQFTVTSTVAENVTYTATDLTIGYVIPQIASVSFINAESFYSSVVAFPTSVLNDGISSSTITVALLDGNLNPIVGNNVSLSQGSGSSIISPPSGPSDVSGLVTFTVTNTTAESVTYTATDTTSGVMILQVANVNFFADESTNSTISAVPAFVMSDGVQFSTITVTLLDGLGSPIVGNNVTLSQGSGGSVISPPSGPSNALGQVTFTVTNTSVEVVTYTATDTTSGKTILQTAQVSFITSESTASTVVANPTTIPSDGIQSSLITVTLIDEFLNPIAGNTVSLSQGGGSSIISPPSGPSDALGRVFFTVTNTTPETVTYQATDVTNSVTLVQTASVTYLPLESEQSKVVANPTLVAADGTSFSTITVTLINGFGNPIIGNTVTLSQGGGSSVITPLSAVTNGFGQATFTVTNTITETIIYTATDTTAGVVIDQTALVNFVQPPLPPSGFAGKKNRNKFATQTEYFNILKWDPSSDPTIVSYEIYQDDVLIAVIPVSGPYVFKINNVNKNKYYVYTIFAVNGEGLRSLPVTIIVS